MSIERDNPHTERLPFCNIVYWNCDSACGKHDDWTRAQIVSLSTFQSVEFPRTDIRRMASTVDLLRQAFENGRDAKATEICNVIGTRQ